jgi:hypothetical protein
MSCRPCSHAVCPIDNACARAIEVTEVMQALDALAEQARPGGGAAADGVDTAGPPPSQARRGAPPPATEPAELA